jgi:hypothetical protein
MDAIVAVSPEGREGGIDSNTAVIHQGVTCNNAE